ncbi:MAG TPA: hypothetical protein VD978_18880 [Azospirillum sp.]|nr:hypothetical protein [Azospirillum sp.]
MRRALFLVLLLVGSAAARAADVNDGRMAVVLPPDIRVGFLEEMRGHMESLDDVISAVAAADFPKAAGTARTALGMGSGKGYGRHMPMEFRAMGMAMHRAALDFADVAAAMPATPGAGDWARAASALANLSSHCRGCHAAFRVQ